MKKIIYICVTLIAFYACGSGYKQEVKTLDSLQNEISNRLLKYEELNIERIKEVAKEAKTNTARLKAVVSDTIDQELGRLMTIYKDYRKADLNYYRRFLQLRDEMEYCIAQLNALSSDLKNDKINKDSVRYYFELERGASLQAIKIYDDLALPLDQFYKTFDSVNVLLLKKIELLENSKNKN